MPGALVLGAQVALVVRVARRHERQAADDLDAVVAQRGDLLRIVRQQSNALVAELVSSAAATS